MTSKNILDKKIILWYNSSIEREVIKMLIRVTIDFEVEDELVNISRSNPKTDEAWAARDEARNEIMKSLYVNFGKCCSTTSYEQTMKETNIKDYKFKILKDNPLIFEL